MAARAAASGLRAETLAPPVFGKERLRRKYAYFRLAPASIRGSGFFLAASRLYLLSRRIVPLMTLLDKFGRQITDLRISVTDRCNFQCVYCRSADPENHRDRGEILSWAELDRLAKIFLGLGIQKIRVTG